MNAPYTLTRTTVGPRHAAPAASLTTRRTGPRSVVWFTMLAALVGNMMTSMEGLHAVSIPLGLVALGLGVGLVAEHRRT